jgi:hypothetical protein
VIRILNEQPPDNVQTAYHLDGLSHNNVDDDCKLLALHNGHLLSLYNNNTLTIWNTEAGETVVSTFCHAEFRDVRGLIDLRNGRVGVCYHEISPFSTVVKFWNIFTGTFQPESITGELNIQRVAVLSDGHLAIQRSSPLLFIHDPVSGALLRTLNFQRSASVMACRNVRQFVCLPNARVAIHLAHKKRCLQIWDTRTGEHVETVCFGFSVADFFLIDDATMGIYTDEVDLKIVSAVTGVVLHSIRHFYGQVLGMLKNGTLVTKHQEENCESIRVWDMKKNKRLDEFNTPSNCKFEQLVCLKSSNCLAGYDSRRGEIKILSCFSCNYII